MRIVLLEMSMRGAGHGPFNAMLLRTVTTALPGETVEHWADPSHNAVLEALCPDLSGRVRFRSLPLGGPEPDQHELLSLRRLWHHLRTLFGVARQYRDAPVLLVVSCLSTSGMIAAALLARAMPSRVRVQFVLHGNISRLRDGWRTRHPLYRALDITSTLGRRPPANMRYLALEETIRDVLVELCPALDGSVDVLPHPANEDETRGPDELPPDAPVRIGMVGLATRSKGFDRFLRLARDVQADLPTGLVEFHLAGRLYARDLATAVPEGLAAPPSTEELPREELIARIRGLHYVCLPYDPHYYDLSASGSLLDAISCCRPVVSLRTRLTERLFAEFGDIGYLCADEAEMAATIRALARHRDPARYRRQVDAMERLRESRMPAALSQRWRASLANFANAAAPPAAVPDPSRPDLHQAEKGRAPSAGD